MPQVHVSLSDRSYDITLGSGLSARIAAFVADLAAKKRRAALAVDASFLAAQSDFVAAVFGEMPRFVVPSGEGSKSLPMMGKLLDFLAEEKLARDGISLACGGGVTGDLAGFAAASYLRGIAFVQVPTTLLSMVDSSVGGKTGINIAAGKNLVGAFWQPLAVFADMEALQTLPPREFSAGMGEVIKTGLLADAGLFDTLEKLPRLDPSSPELAGAVARCCAIKADVVSHDERETAKDGGRALLNLGHTFAHAVENAAGYGVYLHGEAVGLGLFLAARLSEELGLICTADVARVKALLIKYDLPTDLCGGTAKPLALAALEDAAKHDKKVREGQLRYVVMERLGKAATRGDVDPALVRKLWREAGAA